MENSGPLVLDISSDEETGFDNGGNGAGYDIGRGELTEEDFFWLTRLLDEVDENKDDDSDDVVVVSEVFPKPPKKLRSESLKPSAKVGDESHGDDDDCVVLDGDPDKPVVVVNGREENDGDKENDSGSDSDDLEIVGEKGEVACRDFPHPRHLCGNFLFASTPHEVHCSQCHCYVCDSLAPCSDWGTGISTVDHCHANDKDEYWITERKRIKKGGKPMAVNPIHIIPTTSDTSLLEAMFETPQAPDPPQYNSFLQKDLSPLPSHPCSLPSSGSVPTTFNEGRIHRSGHVPMHMPRPELVPLQSHRTHNNIVPLMDGSNNAGSRGTQSFPSHVLVKRTGLMRSSPNNRHVSGPPRLYNSCVRRYHPFQAPSTNRRHGSNPLNIGRHATPSVLPPPLCSPPAMAAGCANYLSSPPQMHSRAYTNCPIRDPVLPQPQILPQPYVNSDFGSAVHLQHKLPSQPGVQNLENQICARSYDVFRPKSPFPPQTLAPHQPDGVTAFGDQMHSRSMISSCSNVGNNFESLPSQPQQQPFSPTTLLNDDQNDIQQGNLTRNGLDASPTDLGINWESSFSCGNQEIDAEIAESSRQQYVTKDNDHRLVAAVENSHPPSVVLADNSSHINGAFEVPISPGWKEFSPDPASVGIDTGTLFDI